MATKPCSKKDMAVSWTEQGYLPVEVIR